MRYPTTHDGLRRRRLLVAGIAITLLLMSSVTYAVLVQRAASPKAAPTDTGPVSVESASAETGPAVTELRALRSTTDPETFARDVAEAIFAWDTATLVGRQDPIEQLVTVADPTGESTSGLVADLNNYLPTTGAWAELAKYQTRQWLAIDSVTTPSQWADAQAQAGDELLPGTAALTIHGTRHRTGIWEGDPVSSEHGVAFTVFIVCGPSYPECHLLRLSMLDNPLD
jgi:hypothetical protein